MRSTASAHRTLFLLALVSAVAASLVRKLWSEQPAWIEALPPLVLLPWVVFPRSRSQGLPAWTGIPVVLVGLHQLVYALLAVRSDWRVGAAAMLLRIAPILLVWIAYYGSARIEWFRRACAFLTVAALANFFVAVGGMAELAGWIVDLSSPIMSVVEGGQSSRMGVQAASGLFSTPWLAGLGMLGAVYFLLCGLSLPRGGTLQRGFAMLVGVLAGIGVCYLSTRRATFLLAAVGLGILVSRVKSLGLVKKMAVLALFASLALYLDHLGIAGDSSGAYQQRSAFLLDRPVQGRIDEIFGPRVSFWLEEKPFGTYLGYAGPEGRAYGVLPPEISRTIEVGAALIAAEQGWLGLLVWCVGISFVSVRAFFALRGSPMEQAGRMLVLFQVAYFALFFFKEALAITNPSLGQFLFWASFGVVARFVQGFDDASATGPAPSRGGRARAQRAPRPARPGARTWGPPLRQPAPR